MGRIRRRTGTTAERSARTGTPGKLPGTAVTAGLSAETGRSAGRGDDKTKPLTCDINKRIYMSHGSRQRSPESRTAQPGSHPAAGACAPARGCRAPRPRLLHLRDSRLSSSVPMGLRPANLHEKVGRNPRPRATPGRALPGRLHSFDPDESPLNPFCPRLHHCATAPSGRHTVPRLLPDRRRCPYRARAASVYQHWRNPPISRPPIRCPDHQSAP